MGTIYRQKFSRRLAGGQVKDYESRVWLCRFYAQGRPWRLSTGEQDQARAQELCDSWERQAKAGLPFNPSPRRGLATVPPAALPLTRVELTAGLDLASYIQARKHLGLAPEVILHEVEQLLSSNSATPR